MFRTGGWYVGLAKLDMFGLRAWVSCLLIGKGEEANGRVGKKVFGCMGKGREGGWVGGWVLVWASESSFVLDQR